MKIEVVNVNENPSLWHLVVQFFELRKNVFVDGKGWDLDIYGSYEYDPYDSFHATYIVAHDNGNVIGGGRLQRTTALGENNHYSYMIRDAYTGVISGLPKDICFSEPPMDKNHWEFTRLISTKTEATSEIIGTAFDHVNSKGGTKCYHLGPPSILRVASKLGYETSPIGPICDHKSGQLQAYCCEII